MAQRSFEPKLGDLALMAKDLSLAKQLAAERGSTFPVLTAAARVYESATDRGFANADLGELIDLAGAIAKSADAAQHR